MKKLVVLFFVASSVGAQSLPLPIPRPTGDKPQVKTVTQPRGQWGGLFSVTIPRACKHPRAMREKQTCQLFVRFPRGAVPPRAPLFFRTWDEAGEEDSVYRIFLSDPSSRGIYVRGVVGHRIFVEVTFR